MGYMVSPCCGAEYTDNDEGLSYCCDAPIVNGICQDKKCLDHAEPLEVLHYTHKKTGFLKKLVLGSFVIFFNVFNIVLSMF